VPAASAFSTARAHRTSEGSTRLIRIDHAAFSGANHAFPELAIQTELIDTVTRWMTNNFG
jgi:hypothetical protein